MNYLILIIPFILTYTVSFTQPEQLGGLERRGLWGASTQFNHPGILINSVEKGKAADKAELKEGDLIIKIDNQSIPDEITYSKIRASLKAGKTADLLIKRGGETLSIALTLDAYPLEEHSKIVFSYNSFYTDHGDKVRTIISRPKGSSGKLPAILFVPWLSCGSVEKPASSKDG